MPRYLLQGHYNAAMVEALHRDGAASRLGAIASGLGSVGGEVESCYWANGGVDSVVIAAFPDDEAAHAAVLAVARHMTDGATVAITRLLDAAEVDTAIARNATLRPPAS